MPRIRIVTLTLLLIFLAICAAACATPETLPPTISSPVPATLTPTVTPTPEPSATVTPNPTENAQATLQANAAQNAAHFETAVAAMTATALVKPTHTPFLTQTPSLTPTPTQPPPLTSREPTIEELEAFLGRSFRFTDSNHQEHITVSLFPEDVNGDGEFDLILHSADAELFILLWAQNEYILGWQERVVFWRGTPTTRVVLEDWTADGFPEIIFDATTLAGGSGWFVYLTNRTIFHCTETTCSVAWKKEIEVRDDLYGWGNLERSHVHTKPILNDGVPSIRAFSEGFTVAHRPSGPDFGYYPSHFSDGIQVLTSTVTLYNWNGITFEPVDEEIVSLPRNIPSDLQTSTTNSDGTLAEVIIRQQLGLDVWMENCQLFIAGNAMAPQFPCSNKFTRVEWLDVVGDNKPEVIVTTFTGLAGGVWENYWVEDRCQSQRLLIFQSTGNTYTPIANVTGCIEESDLYGVRLEDVNGDGQYEIRSRGAYWGGPELLYTFNGTTFALTAELP